jgi:hypothetical protein
MLESRFDEALMAKVHLVCEGANDFHVVKSICGLAWGKDKVPEFGKEFASLSKKKGILDVFASSARDGAGFDSVGLIVDADSNPEKRWSEVSDALVKIGLTDIPKHPPADGFIGTSPKPRRIGVWLSPDNIKPGVIETLFLSLLRPDDPDLPLASEYAGMFASQRTWAGFDPLKAEVYSWLAVRPNPGRPMGENISLTDFPGELSEPARRLAAWVKALCEPLDAD